MVQRYVSHFRCNIWDTFYHEGAGYENANATQGTEIVAFDLRTDLGWLSSHPMNQVKKSVSNKPVANIGSFQLIYNVNLETITFDTVLS